MLDVTESPEKTLSRVERKRRDARARIVQAAEKLMRSKPIEDVTIQDITRAADIGHGTFYLHFKSKYEVLLPVIEATAQRRDELIQQQIKTMEDPAEVVAYSARQMARATLRDPLWMWLLRHSGMPVEDMRDAVGRFAARDFGRGLLSGRFQVPDLALSGSFLMGAYVNGLLACPDTGDQETAIDQVVEMMLRVLGVAAEEAAEIAHKPLPALNDNRGKS